MVKEYREYFAIVSLCNPPPNPPKIALQETTTRSRKLFDIFLKNAFEHSLNLVINTQLKKAKSILFLFRLPNGFF